MSLDVYLTLKGANVSKQSSGIFIRENGQTIEVSEDQWYEKHPGIEPQRFLVRTEQSDEVFCYNITHNLGKMADAAHIYDLLWRPEEIPITKAANMIIPLAHGLKNLIAESDSLKKYNPENGWGNYEGLVAFVKSYLKACIDYPDANVSVSR